MSAPKKGRRRRFITRERAVDNPDFKVSPSPEPHTLTTGSLDGTDSTRPPFFPHRHNSTGDQYSRDWRLNQSHTLDRSWRQPAANGNMSRLGQSHDFRLQTCDLGRKTYDLGQGSSVSSSGESLSRYRPATWLTELEARRTGSLQDGFRDRSCSNSSKAESIASLPCQPTSPASQGSYTAPPQRQQRQNRVPASSQSAPITELGHDYRRKHRCRQPEVCSSGSTASLSNAPLENNLRLLPSPDTRGSSDVSSATSPSFVNAKTYNNIARPYRAPMSFEKTQTLTAPHCNMQLAGKERLLNFNSKTPMSETPDHTPFVKPIPWYQGSTNQLSVDANKTNVAALVQPASTQRVADFTEHKPRSARPFVSRRAHTVDLATIHKWDIATKNSRPRASLSTVIETVKKKKPWDNPVFDHQMVKLDDAMKQLREEIADVNVMLERKSPVKSLSHLDVNSNVTRSSSAANKGRDGSTNIALTTEPPIIISPADGSNAQCATTGDVTSQPLSHDSKPLQRRNQPQQQLAVNERLQRASSFDTADRQNWFTRNRRTAEQNCRLEQKEVVPLYRSDPQQRLMEPVTGPLQRASSFDAADRQNRFNRHLRTVEPNERLGQTENTLPHRGDPYQRLVIPGPLQKASSFDSADRQDTFTLNARTAEPNDIFGQRENVSPYKGVSYKKLSPVPLTGPVQRSSSFDRADRQDRFTQNLRTTEPNSSLGQKEYTPPCRGAAHQKPVEPVVRPLERESSFDTRLLDSKRRTRQKENVPPSRSQTVDRLCEPLDVLLQGVSAFDTAEKKNRFSQNSDFSQNAKTTSMLSGDHKNVPAMHRQPSDGAPPLSNVSASHDTSGPRTLTNCLSPSSYFVPINPVDDTTSSVITDHPPAVVKTTPLKQSCTVDVSSLTNLFSPPDPDSTTVQSQVAKPTAVATATVPSTTDSPVKSAFRRADPNQRAKLVKQRSLPSSFLEDEGEALKLHQAQTRDLEAHEWEESFNRPDSPLAMPLLLPKESIIIRNRCHRTDSSSSNSDSHSSPQRSPCMSPRMRRKKKGERAQTLGGYLAVPGQRNRKAKSDKKIGKSSASNVSASPSPAELPQNASTAMPPGGQPTNQGKLTNECVQTASPVGSTPADPGSTEVSGVKSTGSGTRHDNRRRFQKNEMNLARLKERRDKSLQRKSQLNVLPPGQQDRRGEESLESLSDSSCVVHTQATAAALNNREKSPPWRSLRQESSSPARTVKENSIAEPSQLTNNNISKTRASSKYDLSTSGQETTVTAVVPSDAASKSAANDSMTKTPRSSTATDAQHAKRLNGQMVAATADVTKTGDSSKPVTKVTRQTLDAACSAKTPATTSVVGAKFQCNAKPATSPVHAKTKHTAAVAKTVQSTKAGAATTANSTSLVKSTVSSKPTTKSSAKSSDATISANSATTVIGATTTSAAKLTSAKQSTVGGGAKSVQTGRGSANVQSTAKLATSTTATTTKTKSLANTTTMRPVTTSVGAKTSAIGASSATANTTQNSPKAMTKTVGATKTTTTANQTLGTATAKSSAKMAVGTKATATKVSSAKPVTATQSATTVASKPTTTTATGAKAVTTSSGGIKATATTSETMTMVKSETTTTTVFTTKTQSTTKVTSATPSVISSVKRSEKATKTNESQPTTTTSTANTTRAKTTANGNNRELLTPKAAESLTSDISDVNSAPSSNAAATSSQAVPVATGPYTKTTESSLSHSTGESFQSHHKDKDTKAEAIDGTPEVMTATIRENNTQKVGQTKSSQRDEVGDVSSAVSQSEKTLKVDTGTIMSPPTVSQSDTTGRDDIDAVMSVSQSQTNQDGNNKDVSSAMSFEACQSGDDVEEKVIYTEEQTVSMATVTTKLDTVDSDDKLGDTTYDDDDRLASVPLSPVTAAKCKLARERSPADSAVEDKKFIPTGVRNVFTLVQKFSSGSNLSDLSLSEQEKSPLPGGRGRERFTWDSLDVEDSQLGARQRRTPERTQSFADRRVSPSHGAVQRGASMRNPANYRKVTVVPQRDADKENSTDRENGSEGEAKPARVVLRRRRPVINHNVPNDELARILNRRSLYLENYEAELASSSDGCSSAEKSVSTFEMQLAQRKGRTINSDTDDELQLALRIRRERRAENGDTSVTASGQTLNSDTPQMARTSSAEHDNLSSVTSGSTRHYVATKAMQTNTKAVGTSQVKPLQNSCGSDIVNYSVEKNSVPTANQQHSQERPLNSAVNKTTKMSTPHRVEPVVKKESMVSAKPMLSTETKNSPQQLDVQSSSVENNLTTTAKQRVPLNPHAQEKHMSSTVQKASKDSVSNPVRSSIPPVLKKEARLSEEKSKTSTENNSTTNVKQKHPLQPPTQEKPLSTTVQKALKESTSHLVEQGTPPVLKKETKVSNDKLNCSTETKSSPQSLGVQSSPSKNSVTTSVKHKVPLNPHTHANRMSTTVQNSLKESTSHLVEQSVPRVPKKDTKVTDNKLKQTTETKQPLGVQGSSVENKVTTTVKHKVPLNPHAHQKPLSSTAQKISKESTFHSVEASLPLVSKKETKMSDDKLKPSAETNTSTKSVVLQSSSVENNLTSNVKQKVPLRPPKHCKPLSPSVQNALKVTTVQSVEPSLPSVPRKETKLSDNRSKLSAERKISPQPLDVHNSTEENNLSTSVKHKVPLNPHTHEKRFSSPVQKASKESTSHPVDPSISSVPKKERKLSDDKLKLSKETKISPQPLDVQSSSVVNSVTTIVKHKVPLNPHAHEKPLSSTVQKGLKESISHPVEPSVPPIQKKDSTPCENKSKSSTENPVTTSIKQKPLMQEKPVSSTVQKTLKESTFHPVDPSIPQVPKEEAVVSDDKSHPSSDTKTNPEEPTAPLPSSRGTRMFGLRKTYSMMECDLSPPSQKSRRRHLQRAKTIASPSIDPELAEALSRRRKKTGENEDEEKGNMAGDNRVKSMEALPQEGGQEVGGGDTEEVIKLPSVAERIIQMESKNSLDKDKLPISMTASPTLAISCAQSGPTSPSHRHSPPRSEVMVKADIPISPVTTDDQMLLDRLLSVAEARDAAAERRRKFQRSKDTWRRQTQPVTCSEVSQADKLDSVAAFRAEIQKKTSLNVFKQLQQQSQQLPGKGHVVKKIKGQEIYPEHLQRERLRDRRKNPRYKTLPINLHELGNIVEMESLIPKKLVPDEQTVDVEVEMTFVTDDPQTDDDFETLVEINAQELTKQQSEEMLNFTFTLDVPVGDKCQMTVGDKLSMFCRLHKEAPKASEMPKKATQSSHTKNLLDRRKRLLRHRTQPVTDDEVKQASVMATGEGNQYQADQSTSEKETASGSDDELSKMSLAEKVKMFSMKKAKEENEVVKNVGPRRRPRRMQSRFRTQSAEIEPVTSDEVKKASKISPLAMSLVKPPDPELLQQLSFKDQREFMANWAENTLIQMASGSRSSSQHGSRRGSAGMTDEGESGEDKSIKGILKTSDSHPQTDVRGILKHSVPMPPKKPSSGVKGILKGEPHIHGDVDQHHGILKKDSLAHNRPEGHGILKKESSFETRKDQPDKSVLKKEPSFELKSEPAKGMLKKEPSFEVKVEPDKGVLKPQVTHETKEVKGILKEPTFEVEGHGEPHGILKSGASHKETEVVSESDNSHFAKTQEVEDVSIDYGVVLSSGSSPEEEVSATEEQPPGGTASRVVRRCIPREMRKKSERLAALQKSGEDDWRKRIGKAGEPHQRDALSGVKRRLDPTLRGDRPHSIAVDSLLARQLGNELTESLAASGGDRVRPSGIANRLSCLEGAQANWRNRIDEKDVKQFTVEGKLSAAGKTGESPLMQRRRRIPKSQLNRESESSNGSITPTSPTKTLPVPFSQSNGAKTPQRSRDVSPTSSTPNLFTAVDTPSFKMPATKSDEEADVEAKPREVEVSKADDETFTKFFEGTEEIHSEKIEVTVDDFDHIFIESQDILTTTRKARPQHRRTVGSRNPIKKLAARQDLQEKYTEVRTNVVEKELRRIKREKIIGTVPLAQEALAGLASKENFTKVALKKTASFGAATPGEKLQPYKDLMLLQVKGRRHCQLRLVEPCVHSINSGDCYLLVTPERLYVWIGEYANVMEKAKANELSTYIYQKKDLGCKLSSLPDVIYEDKQHLVAGQNFWDLLGGQAEYQDPGPPEEDEVYEECQEEMTRVYLVQQEQLVAVPEYSNGPLRHAMLNTKQVLVFDFGSEMYVWTGKQVPFAQRKVGLRLAQELWDKGYDYTDCEVNPFSPLHKEGEEGGYPLKADKRPDWALLGKVNQNMETIAFKEKFIDWPDSARLITVKGQETNGSGKSTENPPAELTSCDVKTMLAVNTSPVTLLLEGSHVGRGNTWVEMHEGLRREFEIDTLSVDMWHVLEYEQYQMEPPSFGQLHDNDTYVIRWHYRITQSGMRDLKGQAVNRQTRTGRERCAYFFWQGKASSVTEKGASALMTVELDEERGPQVRVVQGKEPPCFINLFNDTVMIVHFGKREDADTNTTGRYRLYIVRNELPTEAYLMEVECASASLRSRASFLLLNVHTGWLGVWHGAKSSDAIESCALELAQRLEKKCPAEVGLHPDALIRVKEMPEGKETSEFWAALDTNDRSVYDSLLSDTASQDHTARLFYMCSVSGVFEAKEILNSCHNPEGYSPFPFQQSDLHSASQPALFLLDTQYAVYVWSGWWPTETKDEENVKTGSAEARFNIDRKCTLETAIQYCKEKNKASPPAAYLVYAGLEPLSFTNMFPAWEVNESITEINLAEGRKKGEMVVIEDLLAKLTCTKYPWVELQERPLPEGVDPLKLEFYLVDDEFEEVLGMTRTEFYGMPAWKQGNLKKEIGLF